MIYKVAFLFFFGLSAVSGFHTFVTFNSFVKQNSVPVFFTFMNTVLLMLIWFLSYSSDKKFIKDNVTLVVGVPSIVFVLGNFITVALSPEMLFSDFSPFMASSSALILFSYLAARAQTNLESASNKDIVI